MANNFRSQVGGYRANAMQNAMAAMGGSSFDAVTSAGLKSGMDNRQQAIAKANAWTSRGAAALGGMSDFTSQMAGQSAQQGIQMVTSNAIHQQEMAAAKKAKKSSTFGKILGVATSAAGLLLCERRLKQDIESVPTSDAWSLVRDLPLYSFHYKEAPGPTVYGPMIDEVEQLDPSLVKQSLLPPDEEGPIRGFDVARHQAYQTVALQQALQRIELLEARLLRLERPPTALHGRPQYVSLVS
jgi:hypothetical protein